MAVRPDRSATTWLSADPSITTYWKAAKGIAALADTAPRIDPTLEVGGTTETVEVNADSQPELKTDRADISTVFDQQQVSSLSIGDKNFTNLQLLVPGAQKLGWSHAASENPQASQQIIQLEYNLTRNVSIVAVRDQHGVVSFDLRVRRRKK